MLNISSCSLSYDNLENPHGNGFEAVGDLPVKQSGRVSSECHGYTYDNVKCVAVFDISADIQFISVD